MRRIAPIVAVALVVAILIHSAAFAAETSADSTDSRFWWEWGVNFFVAIATFGAALVALFGQAFRAKFFPPKLRIELGDANGDRMPILLQWYDEHGERQERKEDGRFYMLRVWNDRRWSPATQVHVSLLSIDALDASGRFTPVWAGDIPLRWKHHDFFPAQRTIGAPIEAELCNVIKGKGLALNPMINPTNLQPIYKGRTDLILTVRAHSNECDTPVLRLRVVWDGEWHDGAHEMQRHMSVSVADERLDR